MPYKRHDAGILEVGVNLTDAQIKAGFSAPVTILAAPGANLIYQVLGWSISLDNAAGAYVGGGNALLVMNSVQVSLVIGVAFFTADAAASKLRWASASDAPALTSTAVNTALLYTHLTADFTGGNAANKATVNVLYRLRSSLPA